MRPIALLPLLAAVACSPWERLPHGSSAWHELPLWSPDAVALSDGLYVQLPAARALARLTPDGQWEALDLNGSVPARMIAAPDGETLLVFGAYPACDSDDPAIETVEDCEDEGEELITVTELSILREGAVVAQLPVEAHFNALTFTSDGARAVAYLDDTQGVDFDIAGVGNPTKVLFIDLATGESTPVPVGFAADRILFNDDDSRAVVLSRSQVVVVDLTSPDYDIAARFPLSLDVDDRVTPDDVALTPDGRYALITIAGAPELYVLDLEQESINIVTLASPPTDAVVDANADRTLMVFGDDNRVDILEHAYFEVQEVALDEPTTRIVQGDTFALLFNDSGRNDTHDLYRLDPLTTELVEYRLENPAASVALSPEQDYAVAITRPEGGFIDGLEGFYDANWGLEIVDLNGTRTIALVAEAEPVGLAFAEGDGPPTALVLVDGVDDLLRLDLSNGDAAPVELVDTPLGIGAFGDGGYYITHDAALGLVSFLDPTTDTLTPIGGFASIGLIAEHEVPLPVRDGTEG
ncbi:MAG: hypothetical protein H6739_11310 [Alphaproteobacteria bacterium]|nr:hypothetical protein [Alphaproteobacteria bacterium]